MTGHDIKAYMVAQGLIPDGLVANDYPWGLELCDDTAAGEIDLCNDEEEAWCEMTAYADHPRAMEAAAALLTAYQGAKLREMEKEEPGEVRRRCPKCGAYVKSSCPVCGWSKA